MAAVALAIRLYEIDHSHRPATLDELVPDYLPEVPDDPFADDGGKIGYSIENGQEVLHCIGPDKSGQPGQKRRIVFRLGAPPASRPTEERIKRD